MFDRTPREAGYLRALELRSGSQAAGINAYQCPYGGVSSVDPFRYSSRRCFVNLSSYLTATRLGCTPVTFVHKGREAGSPYRHSTVPRSTLLQAKRIHAVT